MESFPLKSHLLNLLHEEYQIQQSFISGLSDAARTETGTFERWSAKDVLAHVTTWRRRLVQRIGAGADAEALPQIDEEDHLNRLSFDENHDRTWSDVKIDVLQTFTNLIKLVEKFSDAELTDPQHFAWQ